MRYEGKILNYEGKILNALLDTYENSLLSRGENKVSVHISFPFNRKTLPVYFDESSLAFEDIHSIVKYLEQKGYIRIIWKKGKENHIIEKVVLCEEHVQEVYQYVRRTPVSTMRMKQLRILEAMADTCQTPTVSSFISWLTERLHQGKTVKEYLNIEDVEETKKLIHAITSIEENQKEIYIREFSVKCFGDTKIFEKRMGLIGKIMRTFGESYTDMETPDILAEHGIYHTPNYVYMKGAGKLLLGTEGPELINLQNLRQGIGLSGEDLDTLIWAELSGVQKVITIENLTTFFRWQMENSILIYLGGYHNAVRRKLLRKIHTALPQAEYLHFGDIDAGGFEIYQDLCKKTGIDFHPYLMGVEQLQQYEEYTRNLTENDKRRITMLLKKEESGNIAEVLEYMLQKDIKLEQECISF